MAPPSVFQLLHKGGTPGRSAGYGVCFTRCTVVWWLDGVVEMYDTLDLNEGLHASYGDQWSVEPDTAGRVPRFLVRETVSQEVKGALAQWPDGSVVLCWEDGTREVWSSALTMDAVLGQYAFEYTFESLDR